MQVTKSKRALANIHVVSFSLFQIKQSEFKIGKLLNEIDAFSLPLSFSACLGLVSAPATVLCASATCGMMNVTHIAARPLLSFDSLDMQTSLRTWELMNMWECCTCTAIHPISIVTPKRNRFFFFPYSIQFYVLFFLGRRNRSESKWASCHLWLRMCDCQLHSLLMIQSN